MPVDERYPLRLSAAELILLINALNEVLHGLDIREFETRLGVDRPTAKRLLDDLKHVADGNVPTE
jgi:DNA-binding IclR family transcriptional regulator